MYSEDGASMFTLKFDDFYQTTLCHVPNEVVFFVATAMGTESQLWPN
jgi:hypothetical protein